MYSNHHDDSSDGTECRRQDEITEANKSIQRGLTSEEEKRSSSQNMDEQSAQNKLIETAFRPEHAMEKYVVDHGIVGQKKRLLGGIKKTKTLWEKWYDTIRVRRNYRETGTSKYSAPISVRLPRLMCMRS